MLYGFTYDGRHSSEFNLTVTSVKRKLHAPVKPRLVSVPQKPGAYNYGKPEIGHLVTEVSVLFTAQDNKSFHDLRRDIIAWLYRDKEVELVFDEEPDKYYMAQFSDESDVDRLGTAGSTTLYFISSDPYAFGETKTQRIANPYAVFKREGIRYRDDGTEVTENYPVYKPGKFDQAILVEEGTENLLPSASAPAQEEMVLSVGDDYYLTTINGTAKIEHKKVEMVNRSLDKEGQDYTNTVDTAWTEGTHNRTEAADDEGNLKLAQGETDIKIWETAADWEDPANTRNNMGASPGLELLVLENLPAWEFADDMSNYAANWRIQTPTADGTVTQNDGYVTIAGTAVTGGNFGIDTQNNASVTVMFPCTLYFLYRGRNSSNVRFIIEDGTANGYTYQLNDAENKWNHYYIRATTTEAIVYKNGVQVATLSNRGGGVANQIQIDIANGGSGDFDIGAVYADWNFDKGPPPSDGWWSGSWETPYMDRSHVGFTSFAAIGWDYW